MITYLDRACIATLAPGIVRDLGLSTIQMGYVFTAFQLAYALFEIPTALVGRPQGHRAVLSRIVLWWSFLTAATAAAFNYPVTARNPLSVRPRRSGRVAVRRPHLFTLDSHSRARNRPGHLFRRRASGRRPDAGCWCYSLLNFMSWRAIFVCFGAVGLVWVAVWHTWFRNDPSEHSAVNEAELAEDRGGAAARLRSRDRMGLLGRAAFATETCSLSA